MANPFLAAKAEVPKNPYGDPFVWCYIALRSWDEQYKARVNMILEPDNELDYMDLIDKIQEFRARKRRKSQIVADGYWLLDYYAEIYESLYGGS